MRPLVITLAGAVGGAMLAVAIILVMAGQGLLPINDRQMQTYLMRHPELAPAMIGQAQAMDELKQKAAQEATLRKVGHAAFFDPKIAFVTGPADAKKTVVEFYDYDCPYCRVSLPAVKKFYEANKNDTRFSFIEFPIKQLHGESAMQAARASLAARRQPAHYMDFNFALLAQEDAITEPVIFVEAQKAGMDVGKLKADMADPAIEKSLHVGRQCLGRRITMPRFRRQRSQGDAIEISAQRSPVRAPGRTIAGRARRGRPDGVLGTAGGRRSWRARIGQQFVQHDAECVDIGCRRYRAAAELLGRRVVRREQACGGLRLCRLVGRCQHLGDAEVEQFRSAVRADQDVRRFQIAVHDKILVRVLHRATDLQKQLQARAQAEVPLTRVLRDRNAVDIIHHQVRRTVGGNAAVDQTSDIRMLQPRQNLPLLAKALHQARSRIRQLLDRDALFELTVVALGQPDLAHAAAADLAKRAPLAELGQRIDAYGRSVHGGSNQRGRSLHEFPSARIGAQKAFEFGAQRSIGATGVSDPRVAFFNRQVQRLLEQFGNAITIHRAAPLLRAAVPKPLTPPPYPCRLAPSLSVCLGRVVPAKNGARHTFSIPRRFRTRW